MDATRKETDVDAVLSDGSLTITDADNAATVSVTNATITTSRSVGESSSWRSAEWWP